MIVYLQESTRSGKKYMVKIVGTDGSTKTVHFGAEGYSDFTKHKDVERKHRYVERHKNNENWGKSGVKTAGFWSRWLLWNKPSMSGSIKDIEERFNVEIIKKRY